MDGTDAAAIVEYWLGTEPGSPDAAVARREVWYRGGPEVDAEIAARFGDRIEAACDGALTGWEGTPEGALALVILLDQFTRNVFRGTADVYRGDALAWQVADRAVAGGRDGALPVTGRVFLYHPFHHSESLAEQNRGVALLEAMEAGAPPEWRPYVRRCIEGFGRHRDIVARFGRFPHRNRVLGRKSTAEEMAFLEADPERFGQGGR